MARPIEFDGQNVVLAGVPEKDIGDLPAYYDGTQILSCWQLDEEEIAEVAQTGMVWISSYNFQPVMSVQGVSPWTEPEADPENPSE